MATKENMTSQRGMLKSLQSKMNTFASILSERAMLLVPEEGAASRRVHSANRVANASVVHRRATPTIIVLLARSRSHFAGLALSARCLPVGDVLD